MNVRGGSGNDDRTTAAPRRLAPPPTTVFLSRLLLLLAHAAADAATGGDVRSSGVGVGGGACEACSSAPEGGFEATLAALRSRRGTSGGAAACGCVTGASVLASPVMRGGDGDDGGLDAPEPAFAALAESQQVLPLAAQHAFPGH